MADPVTLALIGAGTGALMNPDDPLKGAAIGGIGGAIAGPAIGAIGNTAGGFSALTGLQGQQAAMTAAGMGEFGSWGTGLMAEAAASAPGSVAANSLLPNLMAKGSNAFAGGISNIAQNAAEPSNALKMGSNMLMQQKQRPQAAPVAPARPVGAPQAPQRSMVETMTPWTGAKRSAMSGGHAGRYPMTPEQMEMLRRRRLYNPMGY